MYTNFYQNNKQKLIDLKKYSLPNSSDTKMLRIFEQIDSEDLDIYDFSMIFNDDKTRKLIREGKTIGCFYIESPGMRSLLKRLDCDTFEMLTAASSVIRPGVAESGMMQEFIDRHHHPERISYLVPEMEKYLGETYGVMIYQEDVIKVAHHIAGVSLEEADLLRRAMSGKMRSKEALKKIKDNFFSTCMSKGYSKDITQELWRQIESFAGYAFCKAHSGSFALLSFQVAYLKAHYPAEFMASVLSNRGGYYSAAVYVQECKRLGLKVLLPSVNDSGYEYSGINDVVQIGLMAIKGLSSNTINNIIDEREQNGRYSSLSDFIMRVNIGESETELLILAGAMDCFPGSRLLHSRSCKILIKYQQSLRESNLGLFPNHLIEILDKLPKGNEFSIEQICSFEYDFFGYLVTQHPLYFYRRYTNRKDIVKAKDLSRFNKKRVKMIGWFMTSKRIKTKKGEIMKFLSLEDETGTFEAVIFPKVYNQYAEITLSMGPYLVYGKVDVEGGNNLVVEKMAVLSNHTAQAVLQKDSAEHNYYGDAEHFSEDEINLVDSLDADKYKSAYL